MLKLFLILSMTLFSLPSRADDPEKNLSNLILEGANELKCSWELKITEGEISLSLPTQNNPCVATLEDWVVDKAKERGLTLPNEKSYWKVIGGFFVGHVAGKLVDHAQAKAEEKWKEYDRMGREMRENNSRRENEARARSEHVPTARIPDPANPAERWGGRRGPYR